MASSPWTLTERLGEEYMEQWLSIRDARILLANMAKNAHSQKTQEKDKESTREKNTDRDAERSKARNGDSSR